MMPGVIFINIIQAVLEGADPKRAKKTDKLAVFFALFEICACKGFVLNVGKMIPDQVVCVWRR